MATTSFSSVGSGIDFSAITDAIVAQQTRPLTILQSRKSNYQSKSSALKQLNSQLIALTEATRGLTDRTVGTGKLAGASASSVLTASATDAASNATLSIDVTRIASSLVQTSRQYASTSTPVLANGATTATFELRTGGAATGTAITIDSQNDSLAGLRDAINRAGAGVTAAIVDVKGDGTGNQLVLTSTGTGAAGRVELVETTPVSTGTLTDLGISSINPPGATNDFSALDALVKVNGLPITRPTNTISDAVTGVTLNIKQPGTSTVTVQQNSGLLTDKITAFVNAYNAVQDFVASQYQVDASNHPTGVLAGDPTLRSAQATLRDTLNSSFAANGGALTDLTQIGIGRDTSGKLKIDSTVLNDKVKNSFSDVQALLAGSTDGKTGFANQLLSVATGLSDSVSGVVQNAISGLTSSIAGIDKSIQAQTTRLANLRTSLTRQYSVADAAIGQLNSQNTALTAALKSLSSSSSSND